jgi:PAS domain S-box-containing protein
MIVPIAEFILKSERDIAWSAQRARLLGSMAGMAQRRRSALGKAVNSVVRHVLTSFVGGTVTFGLAEDDGKYFIEAVVRGPVGDSDDAAPQTPAEDPDKHQVELIREARQLVDQLIVDGRAIRIRQSLPSQVPPPTEQAVSEWGTALAMRSTQGALVNSQKRIRELADSLEDAQRRGMALEHEFEQVKSLNETLELLALVASKTDNAVIIMDAGGTIEWVNDGFVRMTGYDSPDVRGASLSDFLGGAESESDLSVRQSLDTGHGFSQEVKHRRRDGQAYWASVSVTPVFDDAGKTTRWIGIATDVTRRREAQEELAKARDLAEAANRAKSQFLANISHEIRTPMNAILGMTELALSTDMTEEQKEYLTTVKRSADSLLCLLNDLLDLSKIEAGRLEISAERFDLQELLEDTLKPASVQATQKGLKLTWEVQGDVPHQLIGDDARLRQVLVNLVGNAIKFTHQGGVSVNVESQWQSGDEIGLKISVRDTGIGISGDQLQSIFDAFTQANSATSRRYGGTGLGLTICGHLVELMGGRIWVESVLGAGSTFHCTVRLKTGPGIAIDTERSPSSTQRSMASRGGMRVLTADDNAANRMLVARILQKRGHEVMEAETGAEVLAILREQEVNVLLLDVQMPDSDGFTVTAAIRAQETVGRPRLPIIAVTAYAMDGDRERCLEAGMDGYLAKPVQTRELVALVETLASTRASQSGSHNESPPEALESQFSRALARMDNDFEIFGEQIDLFLSGSPRIMETIRQAIAARDAQALEVAAHRLKGFAVTFDANAVVETALHLERMGRDRDLDESKSVTSELERRLTDLREALSRFRTKDQG